MSTPYRQPARAADPTGPETPASPARDGGNVGWYHDPRGLTGTYRWWDGAEWTDWLTTEPESPPPGPARRTVRPDPLLGPRARRALIVGGTVLAALVIGLAVLTVRGVQAVLNQPPAAVAPADLGVPRIDAPEVVADYSEISIHGIWGASLPSFPFNSEGDSTKARPIPPLIASGASGITSSDSADKYGGSFQVGLVDPSVPGDDGEELGRAVAAARHQRTVDAAERVVSTAEPVVRPGQRAGSTLVEQRAVMRFAGIEGEFETAQIVQAEVWPDGTRIVWTATTIVRIDLTEDPGFLEIRTALDESLASTR